ncbi:hypothetical protein VOLCADRAFT_98515 [Volvox carteri f. nagariensis]|uniref:Uncharacterized protein n=1 Tax=Volvox carteri f. nagariensis TaxID=3068 RepID=D8UFJ5_VOLCA|nr:uncharacterized protein VOLCADRAFT_98515 [Volvox carteri f. nagariensis]EFJ41515.1 hypothetical protein VOLCADRAFT_98515 [Volvox carteri f. nagariensis]|eukprot:XP_002957460.1 hypothetical protein VOLCADRAFT_98515 [Volvox carteri f. nagariensis]
METFVLFCTERHIWNDILTTALITCMAHVHAAKLLDLLVCQQQGAWPWSGATFDYPCDGTVLSKAVSVIRNAHNTWQGIWRLQGPEMYLLFCVCANLSWFAIAVASIRSALVRRFYASGARVVLLVSTKYLPLDGAVLLWQAHVAPVGAVAQAAIAAADTACTFCCCWLLSDRWPYSFSTGTVLAVNLMLAVASLWLAERMEQSDRRAFEIAASKGVGSGTAELGVAQKGCKACLSGIAAVGESSGMAFGATCCDRVAMGMCDCGCMAKGAAVMNAGATAGIGDGCSNNSGVTLDGACGRPMPQAPQQQQEQQHRQQQPWCGLDVWSCLPRRPLTYPGNTVASGNGSGGNAAGPADGPAGAGSCSAGCGTVCSEVSSPGTLSSTRSLSRALPSFSTLSNNSAYGSGAGGSGISAIVLSETGGPSRSASRPSSCVGTPLVARPTVQQQQLQHQPSQRAAPGRVALALAVAPGQGPGPGNATGDRSTAASGGLAAGACPAMQLSTCTCASAQGPAAASHSAVKDICGVCATDSIGTAMASVPASDSAGLAPRQLVLSGAVNGGCSLVGSAIGGHLASTPPGRPELDRASSVRGVSGRDVKRGPLAGLLPTPHGLGTCSGTQHEGDADAARVGLPPSPAAAAAAESGVVSVCATSLLSAGPGPLRQLRRLVQNLAMRGAPAAAAAVVSPSPESQTAVMRACSRHTSTSGIDAPSVAKGNCPSASERPSEPRLCSYQREGAMVAATKARPDGAISAQQCGSGCPVVGEAKARPCSCCDSSAIAPDGHAAANGAVARRLRPPPAAAAPVCEAIVTEATHCALGAVSPSHMLVSADGVLTHTQQPVDLAAAQPHVRRPGGLAVWALSADTVAPIQQRQAVQLQTPFEFATIAAMPSAGPSQRGGACSAVAVGTGPMDSAAAEAGPVVASGRETIVPLSSIAAPAIRPLAPLDVATGLAGTCSGLDVPAFDSPCVALCAAAANSSTQRNFALAKSLASRGGSNAMYDMPALHHIRCSIKLSGLTPSDLPEGFVERVASLLAAAGGSAVAAAAAAAAGHSAPATPALAAVGTYVREGCVEIVADVLVPSEAAAAESLIVASAAGGAAEGGNGSSRISGAVSTGTPGLAPLLPIGEHVAAATVVMRPAAAVPSAPRQHQQQTPAESSSATALHPDRAAAEAMLELMEQSLLPQIHGTLGRPGRGISPMSPLTGGDVRMQAAVGSAQVEAWRQPLSAMATAAAATPLSPAAPQVPPPMTIVCVTPCCVTLRQASGDDTRDRRRPTVTLTIALAGVDASTGGARLPRVFVRHSGRCLAAVVRPCAVSYMGCPTITVELAMSGVRPGLLFLEVAAAAAGGTDGGGGGHGALSLPWPVLVVGDGRVAAEVMRVQHQLDATPLRGAGMADVTAAPHHAPSEAPTAPAALLPLALTPPVTGTTAPDDEEEGERGDGREEEEEDSSDNDSSWASSEELSLYSSACNNGAVVRAQVDLPVGGPVQHLTPALHSPEMCVGSSSSSVGDVSAGASDRYDGLGTGCAEALDGEVQMLLLRGLQPEQELLEGSLDLAAEYELTCRGGPALQSAAVGLGMRLLRFTVLRGWPAAATLLLKGLMVHCRLFFEEVRQLFPSPVAIGEGAAAAGSGGGMPLLHTAVMSGNMSMVRAVKAWAQRYRCNLPWDEPASAVGGLTPLHLAAVQENGRFAGAILGLWPDAEALWAVARDSDGRTPLEYAHMRALSGPAAAPTGSTWQLTGQPAASPPAPVVAEQAITAAAIQPATMATSSSAPPSLPPSQPQQQREAAAGSTETTVAMPPHTQPPPPPVLQGDAGGCRAVDRIVVGDGSTASATAATSEGFSSSCPSSILMTNATTTQGLHGQGNTFGRSYRPSDCGSVATGPDSQWSYSTSTTAQTQPNNQPLGTLQDLRSDLSPVQAAGVHHAINATLLSLANLPDMSSSGSGADGASAAGGGPTTATATEEAPASGTAAFLMGGNALQGQLLALAVAAQEQQQQQQQQQQHNLQPQTAPSGSVRAAFQLDMAGHKSHVASPLSPQMQNPSSHLSQQSSLRASPSTKMGPCSQPIRPPPWQQQQQQQQPGSEGTVLDATAAAAATMEMPPSGATAMSPPAPSNVILLSQPLTANPWHSSQQPQHKLATPTPTGLPLPSPRAPSRGHRLLANTLLSDHANSNSAASLRMRSPPGSIGSSPSPTIAAITGASSAGGASSSSSYSTHFTTTSAVSTFSLFSSAPRGLSCGPGDGQPTTSTRRAAFADDYAPSCLPTAASRTAGLTRMLALMVAGRGDGVAGDLNGALCNRGDALRLAPRQQQYERQYEGQQLRQQEQQHHRHHRHHHHHQEQQQEQQDHLLKASGAAHPEAASGGVKASACMVDDAGSHGHVGRGGPGSSDSVRCSGSVSGYGSSQSHEPTPVAQCALAGTAEGDGDMRFAGSDVAASPAQPLQRSPAVKLAAKAGASTRLLGLRLLLLGMLVLVVAVMLPAVLKLGNNLTDR